MARSRKSAGLSRRFGVGGELNPPRYKPPPRLPPFRWSSPRTSAFLLPSRAAAGLSAGCLLALARLGFAALACFGFGARLAFLGTFAAAAVGSAGLPPFRLCTAFQIRAIAVLRS